MIEWVGRALSGDGGLPIFTTPANATEFWAKEAGDGGGSNGQGGQ